MFIKMKQKLILASVALLMMSCSAGTYYQVVDVKSSNLQKESNNYVYNDGVCKIVYNFWAEGGDAGFLIENHSDEVIYVDLGNTFFIMNGMANNYGVGMNTKIVVEPSTNVASVEKNALAIPPHASKIISEYRIMEDVIQDCSVNLKVKRNQPQGMTYAETESPIVFRNYITYRTDKNVTEPKVIVNDFYVSGYSNYLSTDIIKGKASGCKGTVTKSYNDKYKADRFYVKYDKTHVNNYSADAETASKVTLNDAYYSVKKNKQIIE